VIATGGGTMLRPANREALEASGVVVCLLADPETVVRRVAGTAPGSAGYPRPLLGGDAATEAELIERARALMAARRPLYESFPLPLDTDALTVEQVGARAVELYEANLTPPPPSLRGKGESGAAARKGESGAAAKSVPPSLPGKGKSPAAESVPPSLLGKGV